MSKNDTPTLRPQTELVRGGLARSQFSETSEALYMTSGYVYESAEAAEAAFKGTDPRYIYSRYGTPTVSMFEARRRLLEGAEACRATASTISTPTRWRATAATSAGPGISARAAP